MKPPSHKLPLWCEYEWIGVNRDAWDYLPARPVQHNSCWVGFQSIWGTQSSACWGYNGLIKALCFTGEKTLLLSINQYKEGVSFLSPCSLTQTGGHCCWCWPSTCSQRAYATQECGNERVWGAYLWASTPLIWRCFGFKRVSLWSCCMRSYCDSCGSLCCFSYNPSELCRLLSEAPVRECGLSLMWTVVSAPQKQWSVEPTGPSLLFVCSVTEEVNKFNMQYCAECWGS